MIKLLKHASVFTPTPVGVKDILVIGGKIARMDAAVLAAANITDELYKEQAISENLRNQLKDYLDEANKAKAEASDLRRELFKLQQKLDKK